VQLLLLLLPAWHDPIPSTPWVSMVLHWLPGLLVVGAQLVEQALVVELRMPLARHASQGHGTAGIGSVRVRW
jgi:cytochrome b561